MNRVITITLSVPEGVDVRVSGGPPDDFGSEPLPPPAWIAPGEPTTAAMVPAGGRNGNGAGVCPFHRVPWRSVPAGISCKTGRPYASFVACPEPGCDQRPR
jgi:hypothetical protein